MNYSTAKTMSAAWNFVVHLRLPFQLLLAPFMLWGVVLAHAPVTARFAIAFIVLHVCLYGGTTAFNSHYDRDDGPIGGLEDPPPVGPWLLTGGIALQLFGLIIAWIIGPMFATCCAAFAVLGAAYSHPATRWKGKPLASWATVFVGQGALAVIAGIAATGPKELRVFTNPETVWGILAASALVAAFYPLSQLFQLEEDAARGDRTLAMTLGVRGVMASAIALGAVGLLAFAKCTRDAERSRESIGFLIAIVPFVCAVAWACRVGDAHAVYRRVSVVQRVCGLGFCVYTIARLVST